VDIEKGKEHYLRATDVVAPFSGIEFIPEVYLTRACERGTSVHDAIETILSGFPAIFYDDDVGMYVKSFERFYEEDFAKLDGRMILEQRLYCDTHQITGQLDCVIETADGAIAFDWKTSSREHNRAWRLQAAAYRYLYELSGRAMRKFVFVRLDKNARYPKLIEYQTYNEDLEVFFKCLELYRFFEMQKTRRKI